MPNETSLKAFERFEFTDPALRSVLTLHRKDDHPDGPTKRTEARVIAFFKARMAAASP